MRLLWRKAGKKSKKAIKTGGNCQTDYNSRTEKGYFADKWKSWDFLWYNQKHKQWATVYRKIFITDGCKHW